MLTATTIVNISAIAVAVSAAGTDIRSKKVPNKLVVTAACIGVALNFWRDGIEGIVVSVAGGIVGLALFLPFFMAGGLGGGDVKLCAALGTFFGPIGIFQAALAAAVAGGFCALILVVRRRRLRATFRRMCELSFGQSLNGSASEDSPLWAQPGALCIPYAVPIAAGALFAVFVNWS